MTLDELLKRCHEESPIEKRLVENLYPELSPAIREKLEAQHPIHLPPNTIPDFAFPHAKIAIYCDSYKWHKDKQSFYEDRWQSRELQLLGWVVLRFTGSEINSQIDKVIETIKKALESRGLDMSDSSISERAKSFYNRGLNDLVSFGGNIGYDRAIANFTKAIELYPDFASAFHSRANAYYEIADYTRAIADYTQTIKLNPNSSYSYWGRGAAYGKMGNRKLAEEDYATAELLEDVQQERQVLL